MRRCSIPLAVALAALVLAVRAAAQPLDAAAAAALFPVGRTETLNIIQWGPNALPPVYERSEQLPLTDEEVAKLTEAGFEPAALVKMIEQRRCACDASADGLIRLKKKGVPPDVIAAISLHALKPNRGITLHITLDFEGAGVPASSKAPASAGGGVPREGYLYVFIADGEFTRVLTANLGEALTRRFAHESLVDASDRMLKRQVRRIQLAGEIPLKTHGPRSVLVAASAKPALIHPDGLAPAERAAGQRYTLDYPRSSLQSVCRLNAAFRRDPVLAHRYLFAGSRFECEWN